MAPTTCRADRDFARIKRFERQKRYTSGHFGQRQSAPNLIERLHRMFSRAVSDGIGVFHVPD